MEEDIMATQISGTPYALAAGEGEQLVWFDATILREASDPGIGVIECAISEGGEPPLHVHELTDEWFYLLDGEVPFHCGDENLHGDAGSFVFFPHGIPHTFSVHSGNGPFLVTQTPKSEKPTSEPP